MQLFITIVLDGVGIGEQPDSAQYGDAGSDTLGHVCSHRPLTIPNLTRLGLGRIRSLEGVDVVSDPSASFGKMQEMSAGKDSTTGHWELAGLRLDRPFPTYPNGFPKEVIDSFLSNTNSSGVLGNKAISGTTIVTELGEEHSATGKPIIYTSADSVFQIAAHVGVIPLEELYDLCLIAREQVCVGDHAVGRVIARPFQGEVGNYTRISPSRKDFSLLPTAQTVQEALQEKGVVTVSIGKIFDLFGGIGFSENQKTRSNSDGIRKLSRRISQAAQSSAPTFIWINLVDFDQEFGHRNNPEGFAEALEEFDLGLPEILRTMPDGGRIVITADHGNDPTTPSTDHSREYVPLLYYGSDDANDLGIRSSFRDHAATVADYFDIPFDCGGISFG
ncbi:MAG: phosphopentomutase [Rhodothermia bacterium]|nr:MAG: phosphopentomutase [Rhodothermia bacterium]